MVIQRLFSGYSEVVHWLFRDCSLVILLSNCPQVIQLVYNTIGYRIGFSCPYIPQGH